MLTTQKSNGNLTTFIVGSLAVIAINLFVSIILRNTGSHLIYNTNPIGLQFSPEGVLVVLFISSYFFIHNKIYNTFLIPLIFLFSGIWSNFIEFYFFSFESRAVADYIYIGIAYFNLADIQIWISVILLNYLFWFGVPKNPTETEGWFFDTERASSEIASKN